MVEHSSLYPYSISPHISGAHVILWLSVFKKAVCHNAPNVITDEFEDEELFPDDALSSHTDMVDNEPVINEAKRKFIR